MGVTNYGDGYSCGYGFGCGYGDGYSCGYGFGCGYGDGYSCGYGFGCGYGDGYSCGYGFGCGYGDGYSRGYGFGDGFGFGYGHGFGDGFGFGYGYGCGYGHGYSDGDGFGCGEQTLSIPRASAWIAYHCIRKKGDNFEMRNGQCVAVGQYIHEDRIEMCEKGLHASLSLNDAREYAPDGSVLTEVLVWGNVVVDKDKIVATDRQIVRVVDGGR